MQSYILFFICFIQINSIFKIKKYLFLDNIYHMYNLIQFLFFLLSNQSISCVCTTRFTSFTNENLCRYLHQQFIGMYVTDGLTDKNSPSKKISSVIYDMSVIIISIDLQMDEARKKIYLFYFVDISTGKFNISPTGKQHVMPSMLLFFRRYIHR